MSGAAVDPAPAAARRVQVTLVTGATGAAREAAIALALASEPAIDADAVSVPISSSPPAPAALSTTGASRAVLLEGLPAGHTVLAPSDHLDIQRIAPACLCCTGNLVLRVVLNRILRRRPDNLYIGVATTDHLDQLRSWLQLPPYDQLLELTPDLAG